MYSLPDYKRLLSLLCIIVLLASVLPGLNVRASGDVTSYNVTPGSNPYNIVQGPDGALWFTEILGNRIGRITISGVVNEYATPTGGSEPTGITVGPDGALWFGEWGVNKIGRVTTGGSFNEYPIPTTNARPRSITVGSDNAL